MDIRQLLLRSAPIDVFKNGGSAIPWIVAFFLVTLVIAWAKTRGASGSPNLPGGRQLPPGCRGLGETLSIVLALREGNPAKFFRDRTARFRSSTFMTELARRATVVVQGAEANRFVALREAQRLVRGSWPSYFLELLGEHAPSTLDGDLHKRQRQMLGGCLLGARAMERVVGKVDGMAARHVRELWRKRGRISVLDAAKKYMLRVSYCVFAGADEEGEKWDELQALLKTWRAGLVCIPVKLPGTTYWKAKRARDVLRKHFEGLTERRRLGEAGRPASEDLLSLLLQARDQNGAPLSKEELRDLTLFLIFGGVESMGNTVAFALKFLEEHSNCRARLLQEHEAIALQQKGEPISWKDVLSMKYTWAVLQETIRLRPPASASLKEAMEDLHFGGYTIPKGWKIMYFAAATHENEAYFKNPSKFDPDRFQSATMERLSFVGFGLGLHSCKGIDFARLCMSLYIHHVILSNVQWRSLEPDEKHNFFPVASFTNGYNVQIYTNSCN